MITLYDYIILSVSNETVLIYIPTFYFIIPTYYKLSTYTEGKLVKWNYYTYACTVITDRLYYRSKEFIYLFYIIASIKKVHELCLKLFTTVVRRVFVTLNNLNIPMISVNQISITLKIFNL